MKKFSLFIVLVMMLFVTGCTKTVKKFDDFKEIMDKELTNVTYQMEAHMSFSINGDVESEDINALVKTEDNKMYFHADTMGTSIEAYMEKNENSYTAWTKEDGESEWDGPETLGFDEVEQMIQYPEIEVEEGDFEYVDGVWVGNCNKLVSKLQEELDLSDLMGGLDIQFTIDKYNITLEGEDLKTMEIKISVTSSSGPSSYQSYSVKLEISYIINFSDIGSTNVEKPGEIK